MQAAAIPGLILLSLIIGLFILVIRKVKFQKWDDKAAHVYAGIVLNILASSGLYFTGLMTFGWSVFFGLLIGGPIAGAAKELIYDKLLKKGSPTWPDFWATVYGSVFGIVFSLGILDSIRNATGN